MAATKIKNTSGLRGNAGQWTKETAAAAGRKGGPASAKAKRDRRQLKEVLRELLSEEYKKGSGVSWLAAICTQAVKKASRYGDVRDLKVLAEILGELKQDTVVQASQVLNITTTEGGKELISAIIKGDDKSSGNADDKGL